MLNLKSNPDEEVFVIGKDKNEDIMGIVELTVEYKFTFGLSKVQNEQCRCSTLIESLPERE
jgi:hypothetical protein